MDYGVMNVRQFGAAGDGSADDTAAVQSALNAVPETGGVLYFPPGKYRLREQLRSGCRPITVKGEGIGISVLIWAADAQSTGLFIDQCKQQYDNVDFVRVKELSFWTEKQNEGEGLHISLAGQCAQIGEIHAVVNRVNPRTCVEHCEFRGTSYRHTGWDIGLHLCSGLHTVITNVHVVGCESRFGTAGILFDGAGSPCEVQVSQCWAFYLDKAIWIKDALEGLKVAQCDFVCNERGIHVDQSCLQLTVISCHLNCRSGCIMARHVNQSSISHNLFYKNEGSSVNSFGVQFEGASAYNNISGNTFVNVAHNKDLIFHSIVFTSGANHNLVQGNIFQNPQDGVIMKQGTHDNCVCGNIHHQTPNPYVDEDGRNRYYPM